LLHSHGRGWAQIDPHCLECCDAQLASGMGHFETKSDAFSMRVYRSGPPA
jgi:hypothetical protein